MILGEQLSDCCALAAKVEKGAVVGRGETRQELSQRETWLMW